MTYQIPPQAQAILRQRIQDREMANRLLEDAINLTLAAIGAPPGAKINVGRDGSMTVVLPAVIEAAPAA